MTISVKDNPFQEAFLRSAADIVIGGGAASAGKTFAALLKPLYHTHNKHFGAVYFRRTFSQIKNTGAIWDQSKKVYPLKNARPNESSMQWVFPSGATIKFAHLQHEKNIYDHQGAEYPLIIFDELTHFTEGMFWYLLSRNRSMCGVKPKVMATCNPDPDSFVARLIAWWLDDEGFPIKERAGKLRYFIRYNGSFIWGSTKDEVIEQAGSILTEFQGLINLHDLIKSITFIPGSVYDNKILIEKNPENLANLLSQDEETKMRLLKGNWKVRNDASGLFQADKIADIFTNHIQPSLDRYIICDAAKYGRDFCVIMVFNGWEVIHTSIFKKSDVHDILKEIEELRVKFKVSKSNCLVDGDGVGSDTVKMGQYKSFHGGGKPMKTTTTIENYKNLKTQCAYYLAENIINVGGLKVHCNNQTIKVDGAFTDKIKVGAEVLNVMDLIKADLRSIKRDKIDVEGKQCINTKDEQKAILGRSPDFFDVLNMRAYFEFSVKSVYL